MNPFQTAGPAQHFQYEQRQSNANDNPVPASIHSSQEAGLAYRLPELQFPMVPEEQARPSSRNEPKMPRKDYFSFDGQEGLQEEGPLGTSLQNCIRDRPDPYRELRDNLAQKNQDLRGVIAP